MSDKPLILVDGSSYLFRAYHALPPLLTGSGHPTGALYGVLNMLRKLIRETHPEYMAVIFDTKTKNHRHALFPDYKANRPEMPEELAVQIAPLHEIIQALGLPLIAIEGVEADDVIGTLAQQASEAGQRVVISTGDKDFAQLVNHNITLVNTMTDTLLDVEGVTQKFGVSPDRIVDYLALMGDTADNIPGVPKVGPKTALKWLEMYQSLDGIIKNAMHVSGKVGDNLRATLDELPLYRELVTIQCEQALPVQWTELKCKAPELSKLEVLYQRYEFKSWLRELESLGAATEAPAPVFHLPSRPDTERRYETILDQKTLAAFIEKTKKAPWVSVDLETSSLDTLTATIVGFSLSIAPHEAVYIPCGHTQAEPVQMLLSDILSLLGPLLTDPSVLKVGHNLKYDFSVLLNVGVELKGIACDSMLASYVYNSVSNRHDMGTVCEKYLGIKTISYEDVTGKGAKQINFSEVSIEKATEYSSEDADMALRLSTFFMQNLKETPSVLQVLETIEIPLIPVLATMERRGVLIDASLLQHQSQELATQCQELEDAAFTLAGESFNLNSPKQLQAILYEKLGLPILQKTPTGQPSTAESVLQDLAHQYELPSILLKYRSLSKLKSTYTDRLPEQIHPLTGRIHTSYHQAVTSTGRLSSSDPNLQNIPIRTAQGRQVREAFIAPPGFKIVAADYSQVELRIMAHLSQDKGLLAAFQSGQDIHTATASEIFDVSIDAVTTEQRRHAKTINFGLIYGMSAFGLAKQLDVDRGTAAAYIDHYFARYPGVQNFMNQIRTQASEQGYVETLTGRRLYLPDIRARNLALRKAAERTAINAPMQGTAADLIKIAMIQLQHWIAKQEGKIQMIMQVHDELVFEVSDSFLEVSLQQIDQTMVHALQLDVPLKVDLGIGLNWDAAH